MKNELMNRRAGITRVAGLLGLTMTASLVGCGGGSDPEDESQVPATDTPLYRALMSLRFGLSPTQAITVIGRAPDSTNANNAQTWTDSGQTLILYYRQSGNRTPQLDTARWKWSTTSKTAVYSFRLSEPPTFVVAT